MRITVDTDFMDDVIILVPDQFLDPQQTRELQRVFEEKRVAVILPGRIICKENLDTILVHRERSI